MWRKFKRLFIGCLTCGGWTVDGNLSLCWYCLGKFEERMSAAPEGPLISPLHARYGFLWPPNGEMSRVDLVHGLKGERQAELWVHLAEVFVTQHFCREGARLVRPVIVPIPSKRGPAVRDHASLWAEGLARATDGVVVPVLVHLGGAGLGAQKQGGRSQRSKVRFLADSAGIESLRRVLAQGQSQLVIADDVVTTGATARAAWRALGRPFGCEIWALAHRTTLRNGE